MPRLIYTRFSPLALPVGALIGLVIVLGLAVPSFLTGSNANVMSGEAGPLLLASLGATFVVMIGSIDLSVGSTALLAGSIAAVLLARYPVGLWTVPLVLAVGCLTGLVNGIAYVYGRVPSFVVTLGTLSIFSGLGLNLIQGSPIPFTSNSVTYLAIGRLVPFLQNAGLWALIAWGIMVFLGSATKLGVYLYAIGGNEKVAVLSGIPVNTYKLLAFVLSGMTAALAGLMAVGQLSSGDPTLGSNYLLNSLAAIVIGGTSLSGGSGGVQRTLVGVLIITILDDGLNLLGVGTFTQQIISGAVIVLAAAVLMVRQRGQIVK